MGKMNVCDTASELRRFLFRREWMYLQHSVHYDHLPDFFLAFDMLITHTVVAVIICV
jgi:hypothetical protein